MKYRNFLFDCRRVRIELFTNEKNLNSERLIYLIDFVVTKTHKPKIIFSQFSNTYLI